MHYLAVLAAFRGINVTPFGRFGAGLIGGGVGASLSFAALVPLGGTVRNSRWLLIMFVASLALMIAGGIGLILDETNGKWLPFTLYAPWQLIFAYALSLILTGSPPPWRPRVTR